MKCENCRFSEQVWDDMYRCECARRDLAKINPHYKHMVDKEHSCKWFIPRDKEL